MCLFIVKYHKRHESISVRRVLIKDQSCRVVVDRHYRGAKNRKSEETIVIQITAAVRVLYEWSTQERLAPKTVRNKKREEND